MYPYPTEGEKGNEPDHEPEKELVDENKELSDVQTEEIDPDKLEPEVGAKPKIKFGSGKQRKRSRRKVKSSSESNTPRYSMRIKPTPRRLSSGGHTLRAQRAVNYQENYDYRRVEVEKSQRALQYHQLLCQLLLWRDRQHRWL